MPHPRYSVTSPVLPNEPSCKRVNLSRDEALRSVDFSFSWPAGCASIVAKVFQVRSISRGDQEEGGPSVCEGEIGQFGKKGGVEGRISG
jgi:hypothetical protein